MSIRAVFFDLDGTLLDTAPDMAEALNLLLREHGKVPLAFEQIRKQVSNGANALIKIGFGISPGEARHAELRQSLLDIYASNLADKTRPFPGIIDLLQSLSEHQIAWGVVTNKPQFYTEQLMQKMPFPTAPISVICPEHVSERKPAPEALFRACEEAKIKINEAIYIGDHLRDIQCGLNAGCPTIAVGFGYTDQVDEHLTWQADHCVDQANEIWPIVQRYL